MEFLHMHISSGHGKYFSMYQEFDCGFSIPNGSCHKPCPYSGNTRL